MKHKIGSAKQILNNTDNEYKKLPFGTPFEQWSQEDLQQYNSIPLHHTRGPEENDITSLFAYPLEHPYPVVNVIVDYKSKLITQAGLR
jgi:hypothetical protein